MNLVKKVDKTYRQGKTWKKCEVLKGMVDILSKSDRSRMMARIRGRDTQIEITIRRALWKAGHRYRLHLQDVPGRPDIAFKSYRLAVFIDGCFWHGCPLHSTVPKNNRTFWVQKLESNKKRDLQVEMILKKTGWKILRFWEHEIEKSAEKVVKRIGSVLIRLRKKW